MKTKQVTTKGPARVNLILHGLMATEMNGDFWTLCIPMKGNPHEPEVHAIRYGNPLIPKGLVDLPAGADYELVLTVAKGRPDPAIDDQFLRLKGSALDRQSGEMWAQIKVPKPDLVRGSRAVEMSQQTIADPHSSTAAAVSRPLRVLSDTIVFSYFGNFQDSKFLGSKIKPLSLSEFRWNLCIYSEPPAMGMHQDHSVLLDKMFRTKDGKPLTLVLGTQAFLDSASQWPSAGIDVHEMLTLAELSQGKGNVEELSGDPGGCGQGLIEP